MVAHDEFFEEHQGAAVLKHGILRRYPVVFASMTGSRSTDGRVAYVDAFAGPGRYQDGSPGSPLLALEFAEKSATWQRQVECIFIEQDDHHAADLEQVLTESAAASTSWVVWPGDCATYVDQILEASAGVPLFIFLDPFGTALPFEVLTARLMRGRRSTPTEVLLNLNVQMIGRFGGILRRGIQSDGEQKTIHHLDEFLGPDWWHDYFTRADDPSEPKTTAQIVSDIADEYRRRIHAATGYSSFAVPIRRQPNQKPLFHLTLFYRHAAAPWKFNDAVSSSECDWRRHAARDDMQDEDTLFEADEWWTKERKRRFDLHETDLERAWAAEITANLLRLASPSGTPLEQRIREVYGSALGQAREKHVHHSWDLLSDANQVVPRVPKRQLYRQAIQLKGDLA